MAFATSLQCTFQTQGKSVADNTKPNSVIKEQVEIQAWSFGVKSPYDIATGHTSGKRQHSPLIVTKVQGPFDVMAWKAATTQETISNLVLTVYHTTSNAGQPVAPEEVPYWTITLTNAHVSELTTEMVPAAAVSGAAGIASTASTDTHEITRIQFTFQKIEINAVQDKKSASDDWTV